MYTQDAVRASIAVEFSLYYIPIDLLIDFFAEHWEGWIEDPPEWFDAEYRSLVPTELLVRVNKRLWEDGKDFID